MTAPHTHPQEVVTQFGSDRAAAEQAVDSHDTHELANPQSSGGPYGDSTNFDVREDRGPSTFSDVDTEDAG
jgi:hypothetical protein